MYYSFANWVEIGAKAWLTCFEALLNFIAYLCLSSRYPILTNRCAKNRNFPGLTTIKINIKQLSSVNKYQIRAEYTEKEIADYLKLMQKMDTKNRRYD